MKINLTLAQKAIILVCVPLVFETAFVGILGHLLQQAEAERAQEAHARDLQSQLNHILSSIITAGAGLVVSEYARSKKIHSKYSADADKLKDEFADLLDMVKGHKDEEAAVQHIEDIHKDIRRVLNHAKSDADDSNKLGLVRDFQTLQTLMPRFTSSMGDLMAKQRLIQRAKGKEQAKHRAQITNWLYGGLLFNIALAVGLAMYFNRGTSSRMVILMDNTRRLARGAALNPPIEGTDEIAHLDKTFSEMAVALAAARRKERAIIENTSEVICSLDSALLFTAVNPASIQAWGYTPDELIGKNINTILPEDEIEGIGAKFEKNREAEVLVPIETRLSRKDGGEIEMSWSVQWSKEEQCFFCVAHDITARKQIERMKREFIAMVSHDLRTPLTSIQGFLSLLDAGVYGQISESGMQSLDVADASISRLIKLVNDLLDAERLESGKFELHLGDVDVFKLFESSADTVETYAAQQGVKLAIDTPAAEHNTIYADGDRLIQVLINLLSNSIKFSPAGTTVTLSSVPLGEFIELRVTDQGRGIPADYLDSVFERFKQVKKSDSTNRKGTGLGLAICKAIVEKHGGQIGVSSEEGKGSTFWFRIPQRAPEIIKIEAPELEQQLS